jgi:hypothetical protein
MVTLTFFLDLNLVNYRFPPSGSQAKWNHEVNNTINATILILGIVKQFNLIYSCKISISQFSVPLQLLVSSPQS